MAGSTALSTAEKNEILIFAEEKEGDHCQKIQDIDQMSASEYDQLPDEDKQMYLDAILPIKREEASRRRARFIERMMERRKKVWTFDLYFSSVTIRRENSISLLAYRNLVKAN